MDELKKKFVLKLANGDDEREGKKDIPDKSVVSFLKTKKKVPDKKFHKWAERKGYHVPSAEAKAYELAAKMSRLLHGGKSKGKAPKGINPKEVRQGIKVEKEHTTDADVAEKITKDHMEEITRGYYPALDKMEKALKKR